MQRASNLTILIVNYNSLAFVTLSLFGLLKLSRTLPEVYLIDNGSNPEEILGIKKLKNIYPKLTLFFRDQKNEVPSIAHAKAMDFLCKKVKTKFFMVLDADCVMLKKNWEEYFFLKFKKNVYAVGSQASGKKRKDFPLMYAVMFHTKIFHSLHLSFIPKNSNLNLSNDSGTHIRQIFFSNGYSGFCFKNFETRSFKDGVFPEVFCSEFYVNNKTNKKNLLFSHFGRGSSQGLPKFAKSFTRFIPFLGKKFIFNEALKQKDIWIYRCYQIIGSQF